MLNYILPEDLDNFTQSAKMCLCVVLKVKSSVNSSTVAHQNQQKEISRRNTNYILLKDLDNFAQSVKMWLCFF